MHIFRSMNRRDVVITVIIFFLIGLLTLYGAWLLVVCSTGSTGSAQTLPDHPPMPGASLPENSAPSSPQADSSHRTAESPESQPASSSRLQKYNSLLLTWFSQQFRLTPDRAIGVYYAIIVPICVALIILWHRIVYVPIRCACVFIRQTPIQTEYEDELFVAVPAPSSARQHPAASPHRSKKPQHH